MNYKYSITHRVSGKKVMINFKNKQSLLKHLNSKYDKVNKLDNVYINFAAICLPLKSTVWYVDPDAHTIVTTPVVTKTKSTKSKPVMSNKKLAEHRQLMRFIKRLERKT